MADYSMAAPIVAAGRFNLTTATTEITLDGRSIYALHNFGDADILGSTDGTDVEADAVSAAGQFTLPDDGQIYGLGIQISGVTTLKVAAAATTTQLVIARVALE